MSTNKNIFDETILYPSVKKQTKKKNKRVFRAIYEDVDKLIVLDGKYLGTKPKQAASKAFSKIFKLFVDSGVQLTKQIYFGLKECTRKKKGAKKKVNKCYWYTGIRNKLDVPAKSREKKDISTGTPFINPTTGKPIIDPVSGKEIIDPKTCKPLLNSKTGKPIIIFHHYENIVKKSKEMYCKHLLNFTPKFKDDDNISDTSSQSSFQSISTVEKKPKKKEIEKKPKKKEIEKKPKKKEIEKKPKKKEIEKKPKKKVKKE
jgi:hypothetical protein